MPDRTRGPIEPGAGTAVQVESDAVEIEMVVLILILMTTQLDPGKTRRG